MMANYYRYALRDVTDPREVGLAFGDAPDGTERICIALGGPEINQHLHDDGDDFKRANWIAMTAECAHQLLALLLVSRAEWAEETIAAELVHERRARRRMAEQLKEARRRVRIAVYTLGHPTSGLGDNQVVQAALDTLREVAPGPARRKP